MYYSNPVYVFWTGGYDSTFRICQLLIRYKTAVQPVYIADKYIDNHKEKGTRRQNHINEKNSREDIIAALHRKFPHTKKLLKKTMIVKNANYDAEVIAAMKELKRKKYVRREKCQYGAMAQVAKNLDKHIEVCAEVGGFIHKKLRTKLKCHAKTGCEYRDYTFTADGQDTGLGIFNRFVMPIIGYNKEDMYNEAVEYNYEDILNLTWSCWYPRKGKPCGKCIMCRERYNPIEHFISGNDHDHDHGNGHGNAIAIAIVIAIVIAIAINMPLLS
jgi:7-cyano-7-deazaguanine synthase in queuosine biosynthesis